jgi:selenobiotic family peptide radical SAM maturase
MATFTAQVEEEVMPHPSMKNINIIFQTSRSYLHSEAWERLVAFCPVPGALPDTIVQFGDELNLPGFLADIARLEWAHHETGKQKRKLPKNIKETIVNPTLRMFQCGWKNLGSLLRRKAHLHLQVPEPGDDLVLLWMNFRTGETCVQSATEKDLLVLKMIFENISPESAAETGNVPVGAIDEAVHQAIAQGILLSPPSRIYRDAAMFPSDTNEEFLSAPVFTLQWHITQLCDLHCKHCYDRSERPHLMYSHAMDILDDLRDFCRKRYVRGQVSFTGGNPLMYPKFLNLYRSASERGFATAILGNPAPRDYIEKIATIQKPVFFQVSLEGLPTHNDMIRGPGQFKRVIAFLEILRDLDIYSIVMLTLTNDNLKQVIPLAEVLQDKADLFTFNRLSKTGEGEKLDLPDREAYVRFLDEYLAASEKYTVMGLKDNFFNILFYERGETLFGGCTGYGCGAAFNFLTLLPDGEVHACRKFPSLIGNIFQQNFREIYDSKKASLYRTRPEMCRHCNIRVVCGGCLASSFSYKKEIFRDCDPYCFKSHVKEQTRGKG